MVDGEVKLKIDGDDGGARPSSPKRRNAHTGHSFIIIIHRSILLLAADFFTLTNEALFQFLVDLYAGAAITIGITISMLNWVSPAYEVYDSSFGFAYRMCKDMLTLRVSVLCCIGIPEKCIVSS